LTFGLVSNPHFAQAELPNLANRIANRLFLSYSTDRAHLWSARWRVVAHLLSMHRLVFYILKQKNQVRFVAEPWVRRAPLLSYVSVVYLTF
jgi:hypothetical protein